jgi:AraC family transcriptional regulator of adaptative response / DNA-3-methyladenine glycosylase II
VLRLAYRPPFDWQSMLAFLSARALIGVETIEGGAYARTVELAGCRGWMRVTHSERQCSLLVEFTPSLTPVLPALLSRTRGLFDLDARPDVIAARLRRDRRLARAVTAHPGLRVPGAFDTFEIGVRAILGQQVTVRGASTLASRLVEQYGDPIETPHVALRRLTPPAERLAEVDVDRIVRLGIVSTRARGIVAFARAYQSGALRLDGLHRHPEDVVSSLVAQPGIGPWTAQYIAMRALRWPDAFPKEDQAIRQALGGMTAAEAEAASQTWRPWRSYAVMHLWAGGTARGARTAARTRH